MAASETQNTKALLQRLAEARKAIKSSEKSSEGKRGDKIRVWGVGIVIVSLILMAGGFVALLAGKLVSGTASNYVPTPTQYFFATLLLLFFVGLLTQFVGLLTEFGSLLIRSENQRAQETFEDIIGYVQQGKAIANDYQMDTLDGAEKAVLQLLTRFTERGNGIDRFIKHLPAAIGWIVALLVFNSLFDARQLQTLISSDAVRSFASFQEQVTNQVFTSIVSRLHPLTIFDLLMFALVVNVVAKTYPVLASVAFTRRAGRYRDYLAILEQAKEFRKRFDAEQAVSAAQPGYANSFSEIGEDVANAGNIN